jgi:thiol:disulfide interchange protein
MKKLLLIAAVCWLGFQAGAQEDGWLTNLPQALAKAKAEHKVVLMDFTGSDWCPPCKALHKNVLTSAEFTSYAGTNLVLMLVDFPNHKPQTDDLKKANGALQEKYGIEGYPTVVVLDPGGKVLYKNVGYSGEDTKTFIAAVEKAKQKAPRGT